MNSPFYEVTNGNLLISTNSALLDISVIHNYLSQESYWAKNIQLATVEKSIKHSLCFGVYDGTIQIGFARVITDYTAFAYLCDVFIIEAYRGKGLSKWLMQSIHAHSELQGLRRWLLVTKDAYGLYAQFGWQTLPEDICKRFMQIHNANGYPKV